MTAARTPAALALGSTLHVPQRSPDPQAAPTPETPPYSPRLAMRACLAVSVSILVPHLASRVALGVRADARDVMFNYLYIQSQPCALSGVYAETSPPAEESVDREPSTE